MKVTNLKQLAAAINAVGDGHVAVVEKSWCSTDTKIVGTRLRRAGKGRTGLKLTVKDPKGQQVLHCDTSHTTPLYSALEDAVRLFGERIDLDPGELYEVGESVRVMDFGTLYGTIVAVEMKNKTQAKRYKVKLRNDYVTTVAPWRIRLR